MSWARSPMLDKMYASNMCRNVYYYVPHDFEGEEMCTSESSTLREMYKLEQRK